MSLKKIARLVAVAAALLSGAAYADVITFKFTGTVTYSTYLAPLGSQITGKFAYDTDNSERHQQPRKDLPPGYNHLYANYDIPAPFNLSATVGDHAVGGPNLQVTVFNNQGGNVQDMVIVSGYPAVVDGTTYADGSFGFVLASNFDRDRVLRNTRLPRSYDVQQFDSRLSYGYLQTDGGQTGRLLYFTVDSVDVVETQR